MEFVYGVQYTCTNNINALLQIAGIGLLLRKAISTVKPEQTWTQDLDGTVHIQTDTTLMKRELAFKLGEEFEDKRVDDEVCKVRT